MPESICCNRCNSALTEQEQNYMNGEILCDECYDDETVACERCGNRILQDDNAGDDNLPLCERCYEHYYTRCDHCGRVIHDENSNYDEARERTFCDDCYSSDKTRTIHSYDYKPYPIFYGDGNRYFGVELEIDEGGEDNDNADVLLRIANHENERLYCKHDGSLNEGFELVTHPMTLEYHCGKMPWDELLHESARMDYTSHNAGTCGLHIHVNRASLGSDTYRQEAAIARILYFVETHWIEMLRFSRRTHKQLEDWAARYGRKENPAETLDAAKQNIGRYRCVNLCNHDTIEFRLFRGTLKLNTLIATLQLVNEICNVAVSHSDSALDDISWSDFVCRLDADNVPELITYLKERRLYVNEPVSVVEEI